MRSFPRQVQTVIVLLFLVTLACLYVFRSKEPVALPAATVLPATSTPRPVLPPRVKPTSFAEFLPALKAVRAEASPASDFLAASSSKEEAKRLETLVIRWLRTESEFLTYLGSEAGDLPLEKLSDLRNSTQLRLDAASKLHLVYTMLRPLPAWTFSPSDGFKLEPKEAMEEVNAQYQSTLKALSVLPAEADLGV